MPGTSILDRTFDFLRISRHPILRVYDGFGDADEIVVQGHLLRWGPLPRRHYRKNFLYNLFSLIRLFIIKPWAGQQVEVQFMNDKITVITERDGFFRAEWKPSAMPLPGWRSVTVRYPAEGTSRLESKALVFVPHPSQFSFISDIDDTFLISHSSHLLKRLYVLFTRNARTRRPFDGVTLHYRLLAASGQAVQSNPFFYVSGSEWNLHESITEFCRVNGMPEGVLLLSQIKTFSGILQTGQGHLNSKYIRIARILKAFPSHQYILLGDDSQKDPAIYATVVQDFPGTIFAVYIRMVGKKVKPKVAALMEQMQDEGVHACYFRHSSEAIEHSIRIGLINCGLFTNAG